MPWKASYVGGRGAPEVCAIGLPRGVPEGAGGVPLLGTAACPGRPPMWAEGCAGGVCHSPAEGVCQSRAEGVRRPALLPPRWLPESRPGKWGMRETRSWPRYAS